MDISSRAAERDEQAQVMVTDRGESCDADVYHSRLIMYLVM
jgi:hypothetical protein